MIKFVCKLCGEVISVREQLSGRQIECPKCKKTQIVYIPKEEIPKYPKCRVQMVIRELLDEGKAY